jgi:hypothetical protein
LLGAIAYGFVAAGKLLFGGVGDLASQRDVDGVVLRLRQFDDRRYVAVDEGRADRLWAWRVTPEIYSGLSEHARVTGRVGDHLGHVWRLVSSLEGTGSPRKPMPTAVSVATIPPVVIGTTTACRIDADMVRLVTGCHLEKANGVNAPYLRAFGSEGRLLEAAVYQSRGVGRVILALLESATSGPDGLLGLLRWTPHRFRRQVTGLGDEAFWAVGSTLLVRQGQRVSVVVVALHDVPADRRLEMARTFATRLLDPGRQPLQSLGIQDAEPSAPGPI